MGFENLYAGIALAVIAALWVLSLFHKAAEERHRKRMREFTERGRQVAENDGDLPEAV